LSGGPLRRESFDGRQVIQFSIPERLAGFAAAAARPGEPAAVITREALTSLDGLALPWRLEELQGAIFGHIPELPPSPQIDHLLVVIRPDLTATAYVNELRFTAAVRPAGPVQAGQPLYARDILDISSLDVGVDVPADCAVVLVRTFGWRRALFYDFGPIAEQGQARRYELSAILAQQTLTLVRGRFHEAHAAAALDPGRMRAALGRLEGLLGERCEDEAQYQEFLQEHPWILGGAYRLIERHRALDDHNIPDFTGVRHKDGFRDVVEIKQPFLPCFRAGNAFSANFNDAWNQTERYLAFVRNNRDYLRNEKALVFENPRALLILGHGFDEHQRRLLKDKEGMNLAVEVLTYETILSMGRAILDLAIAAGGAPAL